MTELFKKTLAQCQNCSNILETADKVGGRGHMGKIIIDPRTPESSRNYYKIPKHFKSHKNILSVSYKKIKIPLLLKSIKGRFVFQRDWPSFWPSSAAAQAEAIILLKSILSVSPRTLYLFC